MEKIFEMLEEEVETILSILKIISDDNIRGINLTRAIGVALSKWYSVELKNVKVGDMDLLSASKSIIKKGKNEICTIRDVIDYLIDNEKIKRHMVPIKAYNGEMVPISQYLVI